MEEFYAGLQLFFSVPNFIAIAGGVALGVIVGAIPGLTGTMAVSLALPFTFTMPTITSILLLVGIYKGSIYGGSIPAVLLKTPGTPAASCTVIDGYPLMVQGKARKALAMSLYASCIADFAGSAALIFFTGSIASMALKFGPPEFFMLICFSLTIIVGVSGDSVLKGFIAAALGLLLATVGMDTVYGTNRFVFDSTELMGGIGFIPVLIGVFALPEMFQMAGQVSIRGEAVPQQKEWLTGAELKKYLPAIARGSIIGVILGAIPGIGTAPAAFFSYAEAKRHSKNPAAFGHGSLEGVAAAESGNNGVCAAAMIPLLSLGVPGDVITGIILGAFMMHGLAPGPLLFAEHPALVYAIYVGFLVSGVFLLGIGLVAIRMFLSIGMLPRRLVYPVILVVCFWGVYAVNNQFFDVAVMVAAGVMGYGMLRFSFPAPPFLIAFILGPLCEDNLRRSLVLSDGALSIFFSSFICLFFGAISAITVLVLLYRTVRPPVEKK